MKKTANNDTMVNQSAESIKIDSDAQQAMIEEQKRLDEKIAQREVHVQSFNRTLETRPLEDETLLSESLGDYMGSYELADGTDATLEKAFYSNLALFKQRQKSFKKAYSEMLSPLATMVNCEHYKKLQDKEMSKSPNMFIKNLLGCSKAYASNIKDVVTKFYDKQGNLKNKAYSVFSIGQLIALTKASDKALEDIINRYELACDELSKDKLTDAEFKRWLEVTENQIVLESLGIESPKTKNESKNKPENEPKDKSKTESKTESKEDIEDESKNTVQVEPNYKTALLEIARFFHNDTDVTRRIECVEKVLINYNITLD